MDNRLKYPRKYLRMTQAQLAEVLHMRQNSYSQIETGNVSPTDKNKYLLENKYHLTPGWLDGEDVPMFIKGDAIAGIMEKRLPVTNKEKPKEQISDELVEQRPETPNSCATMSREVFAATRSNLPGNAAVALSDGIDNLHWTLSRLVARLPDLWHYAIDGTLDLTG